MIDVWMPFSPLRKNQSDQFSITDTINGGTTITALSVKIYKGSTDKTATNMPNTSQTYSGNVYTTNVVRDLTANTYVLAATITIDGQVVVRKCEIRVSKDSDIQ